MADDSLAQLRGKLRDFARARDWEQYHNPKNLAAALIVEAAELLEHFQWLTPKQSARLDAGRLEQVRQEIGDVLIYLTRLADVLGIDPVAAARDKMVINEAKYPAQRVPTEYQDRHGSKV
jgi:NTP pyrophosphatase (non-canonical NTP hydrolase)